MISVDLASHVNFDRQHLGAALTQQTVASILDTGFKGEVRPVGIVFSHDFTPDQTRSLTQLPRPTGNRQAAYGLLEYLAAERQRRVREWLSGTRAQECFDDCRSVRFEPKRHVVELPALNMILTVATEQLVQQLWEFPEVLAVVPDTAICDVHDDDIQLLGDAADGTPEKNYGHRDGYPWGWSRLKLPEIHRRGYRGKGLRLGIADAWISDAHEDLAGKIVDYMQVQTPGIAQPAHSIDPYGHGTHMTGIMVGGASSQYQIGGAPEATVVAAGVVREGDGGLLNALRGIEWLIHPTRHARCVNLSFGIKNPQDGDAENLEILIRRAMLLDVVFVAAIGNRTGESRWPARLPSILGVGAVDVDNTVWSKSGIDPDLVAPGVRIFSCLPAGLLKYHGQSYCLKTGTSPATAHVTTLVGLLMNAMDQASADLIIEAFKNTASNANAFNRRLGFGIPDFFEAMRYVRAQLAAASDPS